MLYDDFYDHTMSGLLEEDCFFGNRKNSRYWDLREYY